MNNNIYNALYRTIEDRWAGDGATDILLFKAVGVDTKYSLACYVQASMLINGATQPFSFKLHVKNEEPGATGEAEKYFIEVTDIAPVVHVPKEVENSSEISGTISKSPIEVYHKAVNDGVEYYLKIYQYGDPVVFTNIVTRQEIFFGATTNVLVEKATPGDAILLTTIDGSATNIMRSLKMDTMFTNTQVTDTLNADKIVATTVNSENTVVDNLDTSTLTSNGTLMAKSASFDGTDATFDGEVKFNGETIINNGNELTIKSISANNTTLNLGDIDGGGNSTVKIQEIADVQNVNATNITSDVITTNTLAIDDMAAPANLFKPNKLFVGSLSDANTALPQMSEGEAKMTKMISTNADIGSAKITSESVTNSSITTATVTNFKMGDATITDIVTSGEMTQNLDTQSADSKILTMKSAYDMSSTPLVTSDKLNTIYKYVGKMAYVEI